MIDGSDFGDNILRALPDVIGQTIGNWAAEKVGSIARVIAKLHLRLFP